MKIWSEWQNGRRNKNTSLESIGYKANVSKVQELDTDMKEMTAESLNFWLVRSVFKSNFLRVSRIERQSRKIDFFLFRPNIPLGELI